MIALVLASCIEPEAPEGTWYLAFAKFDPALCPDPELSASAWRSAWDAWPIEHPGGVADLELDAAGGVTGFAVFDPGAPLASGPVDGWLDGREGELQLGGVVYGTALTGTGFRALDRLGSGREPDDAVYGDRCSPEARCAGRCP